MMLQHIFRTF